MAKARMHFLLIALGMAIALLFVGDAATLYRLGFTQTVDAKLYDYRMRLTMPRTADERIVILDIDEKSLKAEGRWPWGRDRLAVLLDKLFNQYTVAVVGFDVVFAEKDNSSGLQMLESLGRNQFRNVPEFQSVLSKMRPTLEYDLRFAEEIKRHNVVLGYYFSNSVNAAATSKSGMLPSPALNERSGGKKVLPLIHWDGYGANLPALQTAARMAGHFNPAVDSDGVIRRIPMLVEYEGGYYESLSLAVVRAVLGMPQITLGQVGDGNLEWLTLESPEGSLDIPVDKNATALVPYRGERNTFRYVSVIDVLQGQVPLAELQNKIVLVGTTAPGLMDMRATPVGEVYPGVEVHANMISGILEQNIKHSPGYMLGINVLLLLGVGLALVFWLPKVSALHGTLTTLSLLAVLSAMNLLAWQQWDIAVPLAGVAGMTLVLYALNMAYGYFAESRTKRQITGLFGQYVPGELVKEMVQHPESISMEGKSQELTILFSDVRGFTTISEGLDSKELAQLMNEFLTPLSRVIYARRGTIDKYMGDCIMAFWGAPLLDEHHAAHAIAAGLEMQKTLAALRPGFKARGWPEINIGVGINTGRVSVGNMGSDVRVAYTVMGDAVNLASRLEGITKEYGVGVLVGENTRAAVTEYVFRELDWVRVKGKEKPVAIYEPVGLVGEVGDAEMAELGRFHSMLERYRKQEWDQAEQMVNELRAGNAGKTVLYDVYAERIAFCRNNPPGTEWDGVFVFKSK